MSKLEMMQTFIVFFSFIDKSKITNYMLITTSQKYQSGTKLHDITIQMH